jgi:predicted dehydrogenase
MRVLIFGLGSIASKHIEALRSIDSLVSIYAFRSSRNSKPVEGVVDVYSLDDISVNFDFILIANPTIHHKDTILKALQFNIPLFIEKPSLASLQGSEEISLEISRANVLTYVACNLRFHPCLVFIKELLHDSKKVINEVNVYCGSYLPNWRAGRNFREIYSANEEQGGGVHLDLVHETDYLYWLFGKPLLVNRMMTNHSSLAISAVDYANYCYQYPGFSAAVVLNYFRRDSKRTFEIVFEDETLMVDLINATISRADGSVVFSSKESITKTYQLQMEYFINCVKMKQKTMNTFDDSIEVLKMCLNEIKK